MLLQFVTDYENMNGGFLAKIQYTPINPICKDWLNITAGFLTSPDYPTMDCSWVITASMGSTISIQFHTFEVPYYVFYFLMRNYLGIEEFDGKKFLKMKTDLGKLFFENLISEKSNALKCNKII